MSHSCFPANSPAACAFIRVIPPRFRFDSFGPTPLPKTPGTLRFAAAMNLSCGRRSSMNQQRSSVPVVGLVLCLMWAVMAWLWPVESGPVWPPSLLWHKVASVTLATCLAIHLFLAVSFESTE
jgi:hypothetical protein